MPCWCGWRQKPSWSVVCIRPWAREREGFSLKPWGMSAGFSCFSSTLRIMDLFVFCREWHTGLFQHTIQCIDFYLDRMCRKIWVMCLCLFAKNDTVLGCNVVFAFGVLLTHVPDPWKSGLTRTWLPSLCCPAASWISSRLTSPRLRSLVGFKNG